MSAKDRFKALEEKKPILEAIVEPEKFNVSKRRRTLVTFAFDPKDIDSFNSLQVKLSARDGILYKKQDLQIACVKQFLEIAKNNIDKIKIEKF